MIFSLPTTRQGRHSFRVLVLDPEGRPIPEESVTLEIDRGFASSSGIPATQTLAVKVIASEASERNTLSPIIEKGTLLPAKGETLFRSARVLKSGDPGHIDLELFQREDGVDDPNISLAIGAFRIRGEDIPEGCAIARGDEIRFRWEMSDSGILTSNLEIQALGQSFDVPRFYVPQAGHKNFEGEDGERLVADALERAEDDLEKAEAALGTSEATRRVRERLEEVRDESIASGDPDSRRAATENARRFRQDLHRLVQAPENRGAVLGQELEGLERDFEQISRENAKPEEIERFNELAGKAREEIQRATKTSLDTAELQIGEMRRIAIRILFATPEFLVTQFVELAKRNYLAIERDIHESLVEEGKAHIEANDMPELSRVIFQLNANQAHIGGDTPGLGLASILRA